MHSLAHVPFLILPICVITSLLTLTLLLSSCMDPVITCRLPGKSGIISPNQGPYFNHICKVHFTCSATGPQGWESADPVLSTTPALLLLAGSSASLGSASSRSSSPTSSSPSGRLGPLHSPLTRSPTPPGLAWGPPGTGSWGLTASLGGPGASHDTWHWADAH